MIATGEAPRLPCDILLTHGTVLTGEGSFAPDAAIAIVADRIAAIGTTDTLVARYIPRTIIDAGLGVVLPGLVNTHNHTPLSIVRGMSEDLGYAPAYTPGIPQGHALSEEEAYLLSRLGVLELLRQGCTTIVDEYRHPQSCAQAIAELGLRGYVGGRIHDVDMVRLAQGEWRLERNIGEATLRENLDLFTSWDGHDNGRIRAVLAPHAPDTCTRELLTEVEVLASARGVAVHTHLAQSEAEVARVREREGMSPVAFLDDLGLLNDQLFAAHCAYVDADDISRIGRGAVNVCHAPLGNAAAGMMAPIAALADAGATVTLCTDSKSNDMFEAMRGGIAISRMRGDGFRFKARDAMHWATTAGAKALGRSTELGQLSEGAKADIIVLDPNATCMCPVVDGFGIVVHSACGMAVRTSIVDGRAVLLDGRPTSIDAAEIVTAAQAVSDRLWKRAGFPVLGVSAS